MRHLTEGVVRRLVDDPAGVAEVNREHLANCPLCQSELAAAQEDAAVAGEALAVDLTTDVDRGWSRLSRGLEVDQRQPVAAAAPQRRWRERLRSPVVAAAGVAAAADWVQIFRTEQIAPVTITQADLLELPDLSAYGEVQVIEEAQVREVADAAAAEEATGLDVAQVSELPDGVVGEPTYQVGGQVSAVFTFSAEKAAETAAATGETLPPPPPGLDGSQFRLVAGPGVATVWPSTRGLPALVVARAVAPAAYSSGIRMETARGYLLSLPGLPEDVATQLRNLSGDGTTLPLPVPAEQVTTSSADVGGMAATVFTSRDGTMAGVVWVEDGIVTAVAGSLSDDEVLSVARGLE